VRIPKLSAGMGWGYAKLCRKPGEFAHAMAAVLRHSDGRLRVVVGTPGGPPFAIDDPDGIEAISARIPGDPAERHIATVNLSRAWNEAHR
jgi:carbon-monoxide dehydrogenase medium subunit